MTRSGQSHIYRVSLIFTLQVGTEIGRERESKVKDAISGFYDVRAPDSAGLDLAVLSLCNHVIRSRGTYGLWGAILAGDS